MLLLLALVVVVAMTVQAAVEQAEFSQAFQAKQAVAVYQ
jgi:hypothetical protein